MTPSRQWTIPLFTFRGINVYLHLSWFFILLWEMEQRRGQYSSLLWNLIEVVSVFVIILLHEFGHALACRQVGGRAEEIVLWPLAGVARVDAPERPGAKLWVIAAGPLVNVALIPVLWMLLASPPGSHGALRDYLSTISDTARLTRAIFYTNLGLLIFNLLPIYPLDGGQILRSLLWFVFGRARSLQIASMIGFVGAVAGGIFALLHFDTWLILLAVFVFSNCRQAWLQSQIYLRMEEAPKRVEFECPKCQAHPPIGAFWRCGRCGAGFDLFETGAICPNCQARHANTRCAECGASTPPEDWQNVIISVERMRRPGGLA